MSLAGTTDSHGFKAATEGPPEGITAPAVKTEQERLPADSVPRQGVFIMTADLRKVKHSVCGGCRRQPVVDLSGRRLSTGIPAEGRTESQTPGGAPAKRVPQPAEALPAGEPAGRYEALLQDEMWGIKAAPRGIHR